MPKFEVMVIWQMAGYMTVEAESEEEALEVARDANLPEGDYIPDSCEVEIYEEPQ